MRERKVVVAVDESEESMYALSWCLTNLVKDHINPNTTLILLYVKPPIPSYSSLDVTELYLKNFPTAVHHHHTPAFCVTAVFAHRRPSQVASLRPSLFSIIAESFSPIIDPIMKNNTCHCGLPPVIRTSMVHEFPAMRYWGCPNVGEHVCCYIDWIDTKPSKLTIEYIKSLRDELKAISTELEAKKAECRELALRADSKNQAIVLYRKERDDLLHQIRVKDFDLNQYKVYEEAESYRAVENYELSEEVKKLKTKLYFQNIILVSTVVLLSVAIAVIF